MIVQPIPIFTSPLLQHHRRWNNNGDISTYEMYFQVGRLPQILTKGASFEASPYVYLCSIANPDVKLDISDIVPKAYNDSVIYVGGVTDFDIQCPTISALPVVPTQSINEYIADFGYYYLEIPFAEIGYTDVFRFTQCNISVPINGIDNFVSFDVRLSKDVFGLNIVDLVDILGEDVRFQFGIQGDTAKAEPEIIEEVIEDNIKRVTPIFRRVINKRQFSFIGTDHIATFFQNLFLFQSISITDQYGTYELDRFAVTTEPREDGHFEKVNITFEVSDNAVGGC